MVRWLAAFAAVSIAASETWAQNPAPAIDRVSAVYGKALIEQDWKALESTLSREFVGIDPDGAIRDRKGWIAFLKRPGPRVNNVWNRRTSLKVFSESAHVVGTFTWTGTLDGRRVRQTERYSSVWRRTGDTWECVALQTVPVAPVKGK